MKENSLVEIILTRYRFVVHVKALPTASCWTSKMQCRYWMCRNIHSWERETSWPCFLCPEGTFLKHISSCASGISRDCLIHLYILILNFPYERFSAYSLGWTCLLTELKCVRWNIRGIDISEATFFFLLLKGVNKIKHKPFFLIDSDVSMKLFHPAMFHKVCDQDELVFLYSAQELSTENSCPINWSWEPQLSIYVVLKRTEI